MVSVSLFENEPNKIVVSAGDYLFREGDKPDYLYILLAGKARILIGTREVEIFEAGQIVGELALIEPGPRSASIQALSTCEFAAINERRFRFLITETPGFALSVMRTMADRLRGADNVILSSN